MAEEKKTYTLKKGAKHQIKVDDTDRKRGTRRKYLHGGDKLKLSEAGALAIRDKLVEFDKPAAKPKAKKKKPAKKKKASTKAKK